ncbi:MAG: hypothetical protein O4861_11425 [Trichodesmium sp. St16_bin4-tuft]|nr:hypothetical protein [Trichodesmium sp. MAG_R01]MDE5072976.1 hypothetical protein [Trichodesmium sp. St5_bin8]MDE5098907.1 hypothetical protein [Trichodesmium sp. St16_bin4-tuft]
MLRSYCYRECDRIPSRHRRTQLMVKNLAKLGYPIEPPKTQGRKVPGRPNIPIALFNVGYVRSRHKNLLNLG